MHPIKTLKEKYNKLKIRTILLIFSTLMTSIFLSISGFVSYQATTDILLDKLDTIEKTNLKQINSSLIGSIDEIKRYAINMSKNTTTIELIEKYMHTGDEYVQKMDLYKSIKGIFDNANIYYSGINSVEYYAQGGEISNYSQSIRHDIPPMTYDKILKSEMYSNALKSSNSLVLIEPGYKDDALGTINAPCFGCIVYKDHLKVGFLLIVMQSKWFDMLLGYDSKTMIYNNNNQYLMWSGDDTLYSSDINLHDLIKFEEGSSSFSNESDDYKITYMRSDINDWIILTFNNISEISYPVGMLRIYSFMAILLSLIISFVLSRYFTFRITKPIYELMSAAERFKIEEKVQFVGIRIKGSSFMMNVMVYFTAIVILPVLVYSVVFISISSKVIQDKVQESLHMTIDRTIDNINEFIERNQRVSTIIIFDKNTQEYLISNIVSKSVNSYDSGRIKNVLDENGALVDNLFETVLYDREGKLVFSTLYSMTDNMEDELFTDISQTYGEVFWINSDNDIYNRYIVKLMRKIKGISNEKYNLKPIGYLSMFYNESSIEKLYKDINVEGYSIFILDKAGTVVSHKSKSMIGKQDTYFPDFTSLGTHSKVETINGQQFLVIYKKIKNLPWVLVSKIPYTDITADKQTILLVNLYTMLAAFFLAFIFSYSLSYYITKIINRLNRNLIRLAEGETIEEFNPDIYINEIKDLAETFDTMARRVQKTMELEKEKKAAELNTLQAQINPHFLYNTLESIKWMNAKGEKDKVSDMITALGDLFRLGINMEKMFIPIAEEVSYAKAYVDIQKLRYGSSIKCFWQIEDNISKCLSPKLIIQPLIENSINHGVRNKEGERWIKVLIIKSGDSILITVSDNGLGIDDNRLAEIRNNLGAHLVGKSIGIFNVQKRIRLYFGEDYGLTINSSLGQGTSVTINIPIMKSEQ